MVRRAAPARLTYTLTHALKRQTVQAYANRLRPTNPAAAQAVAAYMIINWMVIHNVQDPRVITFPMAQRVRRQVPPC